MYCDLKCLLTKLPLFLYRMQKYLDDPFMQGNRIGNKNYVFLEDKEFIYITMAFFAKTSLFVLQKC